MELQRLLSITRKAVDDYHLISEGDRIAVGISGGKDSLAMLYALNGLKRFYPHKFEIEAITVDLGFDGFKTDQIKDLCDNFNVPYTVKKTEIADVVFETRKEDNPCSLCAKMRKGALNEAIKERGCNKVAYAHHKDDVVETLMLSLIYEGRFHTFSPKTYLDRTELTVIRPLLYVNESDIVGFKNKVNLPVQKNPCPADGYTKREYVKELLAQMNKSAPGVKERMFTAIQRSNIKGWNEYYGTDKLIKS